MTKTRETAAVEFDRFTVELTREGDDLTLRVFDCAESITNNIDPNDLRSLAGWLTMQAAKLPPKSAPVDFAISEAPRCVAHHPRFADTQCIRAEGHGGDHGYAGMFWPQEAPTKCGDVRRDFICRLSAGHDGPHAGQGREWIPAEPGLAPMRGEVPMGGRCGNVKYWQAGGPDDARAVCTLPVGHPAAPGHHGPDQTGTNWTWSVGASCCASSPTNDSPEFSCALTAGHKGDHENDLASWPNRLSIG